MNVYHYDKETKEYLYKSIADADPVATKLKGEFVPLIPAYSTLLTPPDTTLNQVACFVDNNWMVTTDYRTTHKIVDDKMMVTDITEIGTPEGYIVENELANKIKNKPNIFMWNENGVLIQKSDEILLLEAKQLKKQEASVKAKFHLESGDALYELTPAKHIEATDGNIGKLSAYALGFITGVYKSSDVVYWNTKEDETITLNQEQLGEVITGLGQVQAYIWNVQFPTYIQQIEASQTVEEVENIVIDYNVKK